MKENAAEEPVVRLVDDDAGVLESLAAMLDCEGYLTKSYPSGAALLDDIDADRPGCILMDVRMPGLSGPEVQKKLLQSGCRLPIVFLTSYSDIDAAVTTVRLGAEDFLIKPVRPEKLLDVLKRALDKDRALRSGLPDREAVVSAVGTLSERPRTVLKLMLKELKDPAIAERLGLSERTVQVYRLQVYKTFGVHSLKEFMLVAPLLKECLDAKA